MVYENGQLLAESERFVADEQMIVADVMCSAKYVERHRRVSHGCQLSTGLTDAAGHRKVSALLLLDRRCAVSCGTLMSRLNAGMEFAW